MQLQRLVLVLAGVLVASATLGHAATSPSSDVVATAPDAAFAALRALLQGADGCAPDEFSCGSRCCQRGAEDCLRSMTRLEPVYRCVPAPKLSANAPTLALAPASPAAPADGSNWALFFVCEGNPELDRRVRRTVNELAAAYGTLPFEPHVTLMPFLQAALPDGLSDEQVMDELSKRSEQLANELPPFTMTLQETTWWDRYWMCVFVWAERTDALLGAHARARQLFAPHSAPEPAPVPPYTPHLSLLYGTEQQVSMEQRQAIALELKDAFKGVAVPITAIHLYDSSGPEDTWKFIRAFPLRGPAQQQALE